VVDQPQVLRGDPGAGELLVIGVAGVEPGEQPFLRALGVMVMAAAQEAADPVERVAGAAAVPGLFTLDAVADVVDGGEPEPHDVEPVEHPHRDR